MPRSVLLALLLLLALPAAAEDFPSAGAFARGRAGLGVLAEDAGAVLANPAALGLHGQGTLLDLSLAGALHSGVPGGAWGSTMVGELGYVARFPGRAPWLPVLGLLVQTPLDGAFRLSIPANDQRFWPQLGLEERQTRLALGCSSQVLDGLHLGASVEYVPGVSGFVRLDLDDPEGRNQVDVRVDSGLAPFLGLLWQPATTLDLGLSWSFGQQAGLNMPVRVLASSIDINARILGQLYQRPPTLRLGLAWRPAAAWTIRGELGWQRYSLLGSPFADLALYGADGEDSLEVVRPALKMQDSVVGRLALDWQLAKAQLGLGLALETPPCDSSTGLANARCDFIYRASAGLRAPLFKVPLPVLAHLELGSRFSTRRWVEKDQVLAGNPGYPGEEQGLLALEASLGLTIDFR